MKNDIVGMMNAVLIEMRQKNPPPIITPEEKAKRERILRTELEEAAWLIGSSAASEISVFCGICDKQSPKRSRTPYPFRAEAGGSFTAYVGATDAVNLTLCPECCIAVWEFLLKRKEK